MSTHRVMGPFLWDALNAKRQLQGLSWRGLARELDLAPSAFSRLKHPSHGVHADALVTMLAWLEADWRSYTIRHTI